MIPPPTPLREDPTVSGPYERFEGIKQTIRAQLMIPSREFKYERRENTNDGTELHTIYTSKPMKALELSVMTEDELLKLREFWTHACDQALDTVRALDHNAVVLLATGKPTKRLYRPEAKLLIFEEKGGVPREWNPDKPE